MNIIVTYSIVSSRILIEITNGCNGAEMNVANGFAIDSDGVIVEMGPHHDFDTSGWICYSFDPVQATAIGFGFNQDCCSHLKLKEFQIMGQTGKQCKFYMKGRIIEVLCFFHFSYSPQSYSHDKNIST